MGIWRSTDPTTFDDVDGIIINETAPAPNVKGVATNIAILVGEFTAGPYELTEVGSIGEMLEIYQGGSGFTALKNKKFGRLRVIRVQGTGTAGAVTDSDYEDAIEKAAVEGAGNILFLDSYNSVRNGYLEAHVAATQDKIAILCGPEVQTAAEAITDVASYRDADGRLIYAYPWVQTIVDGESVMTNPASWYASILSQTAPHIDPAYVSNTRFLGGITGLKYPLSRAQYIQLKDAGISAFEYDEDIGFKVKSGVTTQILDSSKVAVLRRRMADYISNSVAKYLKNYQNAPNTLENRTAVKAAIQAWDQEQENLGILPKDAEVKTGKAKIIDTEALNTDESIGQGFFKILYKRRIYSSMRYIVLQAEIGESVVVTEGEA